jgi:hypothetical protein
MKTLSLRVVPKEIWQDLRAGKIKDAKDISWKILNQKWDCIEDSEYGDSAENNLGLRIFEQALDWSIGLKVGNFINSCVKNYKRLPKPFTLKIKGDNFSVCLASGKEIAI